MRMGYRPLFHRGGRAPGAIPYPRAPSTPTISNFDRRFGHGGYWRGDHLSAVFHPLLDVAHLDRATEGEMAESGILGRRRILRVRVRAGAPAVGRGRFGDRKRQPSATCADG